MLRKNTYIRKNIYIYIYIYISRVILVQKCVFVYFRFTSIYNLLVRVSKFWWRIQKSISFRAEINPTFNSLFCIFMCFLLCFNFFLLSIQNQKYRCILGPRAGTHVVPLFNLCPRENPEHVEAGWLCRGRRISSLEWMLIDTQTQSAVVLRCRASTPRDKSMKRIWTRHNCNKNTYCIQKTA